MRTVPWKFNGIYKYCKVDTAIKIIETGSFLLQTPSAFNDPFEATPNVYRAVKRLPYDWFRSPEAFKLNHYCYQLTGHMIGIEVPILYGNISSHHTNRISLEVFIKIAKSKNYPELWYNDYVDYKDGYMDCIRALVKRKADDFRTTCFSRSYNSVLMWSHYAESHKGCLLAFCNGDLEEKTVPVEYRTSMNELDLNDGITDIYLQKCLCTKSTCWKYERECRLILPSHECKRNDANQHIFEFEVDELCGVALGSRCSFEDGLKVERALRDKGLSLNVHMGQAFLHPFQYKIEIYGNPDAMSNGGRIIWPMLYKHSIT